MDRKLFDEEHDLFRDSVRRFVAKEIVPHHEEWEAAGKVDKAMFREAGAHGFLGMAIPEEHGGGGVDDFRYNVIINEEIQAAGVCGSGFCITLHNDIVLPYFLAYSTPEQAQRWFPGLADGSLMGAIAMTEPGMGSDLAAMGTRAVVEGDHFVVNGSKTFITNGINSDLVITAVMTDPGARHRGMSLLVVEEGTEGFSRGRNLAKMGIKSQDTAELFFDDARVPVANLLGGEGQGFLNLVRNLPQERLSIAVTAVAHARAAYEWTVGYVKEREAFGQKLASFQNTRFVLAEVATELDLAQVFVDRQVEALGRGELTAEDAAEAKWWCTEMQKRSIDRCLQLFGGYGYMLKYPITKAYLDSLVHTIYAATTEIMKEIIARSELGR